MSELLLRRAIHWRRTACACTSLPPNRGLVFVWRWLGYGFGFFQEDAQPLADGVGGPVHGLQGHGGGTGVEQPVHGWTARVHPPGQLGFRDALLLHRLTDLPGQDPLDGDHVRPLRDAFLFEETVEGGAEMASFLHRCVLPLIALRGQRTGCANFDAAGQADSCPPMNRGPAARPPLPEPAPK